MKKAGNIYTLLIFAFLYAPIAVFIFFSFNQSKSRVKFTGFSLRWYKDLFNNDLIMSALINTLIVAVLSAVIATIIGTAASLGISSMKRLPRTAVMNVTYLPILNPDIVTGISLMLLFVAMGGVLRIGLGFWSVLIAHITFNIPYVILNVLPKIRQADKNLMDAAQDLGCNVRKAFIKVMIPEIMPGVLSGMLMAFSLSFDDFVISYFTSGSSFETLPVALYSATRRRVSPEYNALFALLFVTVMILLVAMNLSGTRKKKKAAL